MPIQCNFQAILAAIALLAVACNEQTSPVTGTVPSAPPSSAELAFPSEAEIALARVIPIRAGTMIGSHGRINALTQDPANCGSPTETQRGRTSEFVGADGRGMALRFNISGGTPCTLEFSARGLRYEPMTRIMQLQDGRFVTSGPAMMCIFTALAHRCRAIET